MNLAGREADWSAFETLNRAKYGTGPLPFAHRVVLELARGDSGALSRALEEGSREGRELFHLAGDITLFLNQPATAERVLRLGTAAGRAPDFRDSTYRRLAALHVAQGRWADAKADYAAADRAGSRLVWLDRAWMSLLPFLPVPRSDLEQTRNDLERWDVARDPPPTKSPLEAALAAHLRLFQLGLVNSRLGDEAQALRYANEVERLPPPPGAAAVTQTLARTIRAETALRRGRAAEALRELETVRGEIPVALVYVRPYSEERARYLRAEGLLQQGQDAEALRWLQHGFATTPSEAQYHAPIDLRQAQIYERLGDRRKAIERYQLFIRFWQRCDPALRPAVDSARSRVASLVREAD